jgi:large subunit ribosomal protein L10
VDNPRAEKVAVATEVRERLADADAAILTEYRGLKVKDLAQLRRNLAPVGGDYRVYKNTLARFAVREVGHEDLVPMLEGPTAITFIKGDPAAVAKVLRDFSGTNPLLVIKGGVLGDSVMGAAETTALASLPSREVLLGRLAGGLAAPLTQMARLLQALPQNLAYGLQALIDQKGGPSAADETVGTADQPVAAGADA